MMFLRLQAYKTFAEEAITPGRRSTQNTLSMSLNVLNWALLVIGFAGLIVGGNLLVQGAVAIATRLNVSPMIIGLTLVGFGTSTPELLTSVQASLAGSPGIAVGNVVGSNIANVLLILGVAALLSPIRINPAALRRDGAVLMLASLLCLAGVLYGTMTFASGLFLIATLAVYLAATIFVERRAQTPAAAVYETEAASVPEPDPSLLRGCLSMVVGLAITLVGARLLVSSAVSIASDLGVSEALIGLSVVAIGTSLPELVTSIIAARKGQSDVALGNVIGSNIFNILGILGVTALLRPIEIPQVIATVDIWVMMLATVVVLSFAWTGSRIDRREAAVLLAGYAAYMTWLSLSA